MTRRAFVAVSTLLCIAACMSPPTAAAACVPVVVVDGTVLFGYRAERWKVPPPAGSRRAVVPACNDAGQNDPDTVTTVRRFQDVPADVAVRSVRGDRVYLAEGSLTALSEHPLYLRGRRAKRANCGRQQRMGGAAGRSGFDTLSLRSGGRERLIRVDERTRLTNRPAYQPVPEGQRLRITARRCRNRLIANEITFVGSTRRPVQYRGQTVATDREGVPWGFIALGPLCLALVALALRGRSRR